VPSLSTRDLAALYREHAAPVWNAALHLTGDPATAEDVLHDVFLALARGPTTAIATPRTYLLRAALHRVRDLLRRRTPTLAGELDALLGHAPGPELAAIAGERASAVTAALSTLPLAQREVAVLHAFEDMSFRAIGELCGISEDTAASRWRYASEKLRVRLARQGVES
jgi:RNA polymerase sigma-70 factor (ECF subfamily)